MAKKDTLVETAYRNLMNFLGSKSGANDPAAVPPIRYDLSADPRKDIPVPFGFFYEAARGMTPEKFRPPGFPYNVTTQEMNQYFDNPDVPLQTRVLFSNLQHPYQTSEVIKNMASRNSQDSFGRMLEAIKRYQNQVNQTANEAAQAARDRVALPERGKGIE